MWPLRMAGTWMHLVALNFIVGLCLQANLVRSVFLSGSHSSTISSLSGAWKGPQRVGGGVWLEITCLPFDLHIFQNGS